MHMDPLKKKDDLNEAVWDNIMSRIGLGANNASQNKVVRSLGGGKYELGGNLIHKLAGVSEQQLMQYDWNAGRLSFLKDGKWEAKELDLQMAGGTEAVTLFLGEWHSGSFIGNMFGDFRGDSFEGYYQSAYEAYGSDPSTFVDGRILDHKRGVLGLPKVDVISIDKNSQKKHVSLLELQVGQYCNLTDDRGVTHSFRMAKCCDNIDMSIELEEQTGQRRAISIGWKEIRKSNDPSLFRRTSSIRVGGKIQIPYLFANDRVGVITNIEVSTKPTMFGTTNDTYMLDTSLIRPLKFNLPRTTVHLLSQEEVMEFGKINQDLDNNAMQLHLSNIRDGIRFNLITGWNGYPHLNMMFTGVEGSPVVHKKYAASMDWMDRFVQFVVLRMVKSKPNKGVYDPNEVGRKIVMNQLKMVVEQAGFNATQPAVGQTVPNTSMPPKGKSMIP